MRMIPHPLDDTDLARLDWSECDRGCDEQDHTTIYFREIRTKFANDLLFLLALSVQSQTGKPKTKLDTQIR